MFRVALVKPGPITDDLWEWMVPGLEEALVFDPHPFSLDDIRQNLQDEIWIAVLGYVEDEPRGFFLVEMGNLGSHLKAVRIPYAWVMRGTPGLRKFIHEEVKTFARREGCKAFVFQSIRKGWMREFTPMSINFLEDL